VLSYGYRELEQMHGKEGAKHIAQSYTTAINTIEAIATQENINCDFERLDGYLFPPTPAPLPLLICRLQVIDLLH
jgi:hypothetical protein